MQRPLELTFDGVDKQPWIEDLVRRRVDKLERFHDRITGCRVAIEQPHKSATSGNPHRVRIDLTVPPGHELVVSKGPGDGELNEALRTILTRAFDAAERQLKELADKQRREVKTHDEPFALVLRKFSDEGYGFVKTPEGREIYFHRNAVTGNDFERLEVGTMVRFEETLGEEGPQATTVQIIDKPGVASPEEGVIETAAGWERSSS